MWSRKVIAFAVVLSAVCLLGRILCQAQEEESSKPPKNVLYPVPVRLMLKGDKRTVQEEVAAKLLKEKFYPIGWSKDGKFAYYVEPADEACGCYLAQLVIQDLRTDKILWERSYSSEQSSINSLKKYWAKNRKEFSSKLVQYGIQAQKRFALQNSAINYQKDILNPKINVNVSIEAESSVSVTGKVVLELISKQNGRKTIYETKFDPDKFETFRDAHISGSLLSPFESRAAIVITEMHRGWEGPPNITRIRIVGTSLTTGFH